MTSRLLIDDTRTFRDPQYTHRRARTSREGLDLLKAVVAAGEHVDELWLDHDLGQLPDGTPDSVLVVLDYLAELAAHGTPLDVDLVVVHTGNPVGAADLLRGLDRWAYRTRRVPAVDHLIDERP